MTSPDPSPNIAALESFLESQPAEVRELLQYALAKLMVEEGKATFGEEFVDLENRAHVQVVTRAGQSFVVIRPAVGDAMLEQMMAIVRQAGERGTAGEGGTAGAVGVVE